MSSFVDSGPNRAGRDPAVVDPPAGTVAAGNKKGRRQGGVGRAIGVAVLAVGLQVLLIALFAWPAIKTAPRDLPVVVAAPPSAATALTQQLATTRPGAFQVTTVADEAAATAALRNREAYAAFVLRPQGPVLLVASAASPVVAQLLTQQAQALGGGASPVPVVDVVPTDRDDPRGAGFAAGLLPMVLTSMLAGILVLAAVRARWARLTGVIVFAVGAGLAGAAVLQYWMGALPGSYAINAGVIGLVALAISGAIAGLGAVLGAAGIGLGAVAVFLVGNPLSAVASAPELLPQPWGEVGQFLPPGAGATLLRSAAYFDGAGGTAALWTLGAWALGGIVLLLIGWRRIGAH